MKRIVIHFEDEAGSHLATHERKYGLVKGDLVSMCGVAYVVYWRRASATSVEFGARPERAGVEVQEFSAEEIRP